LEIARRQIWKRQHQIREIALRIDDEGRNAVDRRFLDQSDAQAGLAAAGHADTHRVRREIACIVQNQLVARRAAVRKADFTEIECAELFRSPA
jgi:hypothetical protein